MKRNLHIITTACCIAVSSGTQAQTIDYTAMQELFGEPVTTSANGAPQRASDVALDMTIITAEDIERFPATEIPDILRHYAGLSVRQHSSSEYSVGIRGYANPGNERILVLVNGRQVFEDYYGLVNWSAIPVSLNEIRQIEVIRGPNTALFGFNATSGVVNIITHNPLFDDTDIAEADIGVNNYLRGSAIYTLQHENRYGLRVSIDRQTIDDDRTRTNPLSLNDLEDRSLSRNFSTDFAAQIDDTTTARLEVSQASVDENNFDAFYDYYGRKTENSSVRASVSSDTEYGLIDAALYRNSVNAKYDQRGMANNLAGFKNDVVVAQLSNTFKLTAEHTIRLAGEYRQNDTDYNFSALGGYLGTTGMNMGSVSALWGWHINNALSLSVAGRYDHAQTDYDGTIFTGIGNPFTNDDYNNHFDEFGYNVGLVYKLTDEETLRFAIAKGVDLPSPFEMGVQVGSAFGDPTLDASEIYDYQIGFESKLPSINAMFKTTAFYQMIDAQQGFKIVGVTNFTDNIGDSSSYGFETGLNGTTNGGIRWGANYSYSQIEDDIIGTSTVNYERENSDHIINANLGYSPNPFWDMDMFASYQSNFRQQRGMGGLTTPNAVHSINPDAIIDTRIAYKPTQQVTLSVNGRALFGDNEQSSVGDDVDRQLFLRAKYSF